MKSFVESLETRTFLADTLVAAVNFAPLSAPRAPGMLTDYGVAYGVRRGGLSYGWDTDRQANTVQRNVTSVRRNDTFINMPGGAKWEIGVDNGTYSVYLVAGDPARTGDRIALSAEGSIAIAGMTKARKPFLEGAVQVVVTDGRLTIASAGEFGRDKLSYLAVTRIGDATGGENESPAPTGNLTWARGADSPVLRVESATATVGGYMYVFGGYGEGAGTGGYGGGGWQPSARVDRYNVNTNTWQRMADMPIGFNHAAVAVVGNNVWLAGGFYARPGTTDKQDFGSTAVRVYNTQTNTWSTGPSLPAKRASGGLALVNNTLYHISGEGTDRLNKSETWALDLGNQSAGWVSKASIPQARGHFGINVLNGNVYVFGGWIGYDETSTALATSYVYKPSTNTWQRIADLPRPTSHLSPATYTVGNQAFIFGGEGVFNDEYSHVLRYNPTTNTYTTLTSLPVTRASGAVGYLDGKFVFVGGKDGSFTDDTYIGTFS